LQKDFGEKYFLTTSFLGHVPNLSEEAGHKLGNKKILFVSKWGARKMKIGSSPLSMPSAEFWQWGG